MTALTELIDIIKGFNYNTHLETNFLQKQTTQIKLQYSAHPAIAPLLTMMQTLAKYLDSKKDKSHPDSIPVMLSIAGQLQKLTDRTNFDPDKNKDDINRIVSGEIKKYKDLQNKINPAQIITQTDLNRLKTAILTIDWEISEQTLERFEKIVNEFLSAYQHNKIYYHFLKIVQSLGQYIGLRKANAHPDALSFLRSVFDSFEKVIQAPGLSHQNKKEILEKTIHQFNDLKTRISKEKKEQPSIKDAAEEEILPPALSHIKSASRDFAPVTRLSELTNAADDEDAIIPALSGMEMPLSAPRDVMGDLFSLKASPADELLDAIHLMDVHGSGQMPASKMPDQNPHSPSSGIKQFTPELKNNTPIPEIEDRLDEFFNLETSPQDPVRSLQPSIETVELTIEQKEEKTEGIVPFQYEDETVDPGDMDHDGQITETEQASDILYRLKADMDTLTALNPEPGLLSIKDDISKLKLFWLNDTEKTALLELFSQSLRFLEKEIPSPLPAENPMDGDGKNPIPQLHRETPAGLFARIKALFIS